MKNLEGYTSLYNLAHSLGMSEQRFRYHVKLAYIAAPSFPFGKRKFYTKQAAGKIREYFKQLAALKDHRKAMKEGE